MLTPEDIDKQQFSKQFKGYAVEEVDDFLEELTNDYEVLMLANKKQEDKIKELEAKIDGLSTNTNVLQETLLIAKQTADEMRRRAEEEANMIVGEAKKMLEDRAGNIDQIIEEKQNTLKFLQNEIETYKAKAERMLIEQLEVLKKIEEQQQN
jgi:divIVA family protein